MTVSSIRRQSDVAESARIRMFGKVDNALRTLDAFAVGKPVVIEETFPLKCSIAEFGHFIDKSAKHAAGWIGFYWGKTPRRIASVEDDPGCPDFGLAGAVREKGEGIGKIHP